MRTLMSLSLRTDFQSSLGRPLSARSQTSLTICSAVSISKQQFFLRRSSVRTCQRKQWLTHLKSSKILGTVSRHSPLTSQPAMMTGQVKLESKSATHVSAFRSTLHSQHRHRQYRISGAGCAVQTTLQNLFCKLLDPRIASWDIENLA
jgi:hypothetical protein